MKQTAFQLMALSIIYRGIGGRFEWKITSSSYRIKIRRRKEDPTRPNNFSKTNPLIVELKIYGDIDATNKDEFLVDIHGSVMEFLEFSSSFVSSIQQAGFIVFK